MESICAAVVQFEEQYLKIHLENCRNNTEKFSTKRFLNEMKQYIEEHK